LGRKGPGRNGQMSFAREQESCDGTKEFPSYGEDKSALQSNYHDVWGWGGGGKRFNQFPRVVRNELREVWKSSERRKKLKDGSHRFGGSQHKENGPSSFSEVSAIGGIKGADKEAWRGGGETHFPWICAKEQQPRERGSGKDLGRKRFANVRRKSEKGGKRLNAFLKYDR